MRRHCKPWLRRTAAASFAAVAAGCATGPAFVAPEPPRAGRAVVYIYRSSSMFGAGVKPQVWVAGRPVGTMLSGGYLRVEVASGPTEIVSPNCGPIGMPVAFEAGSVAYMQLELVNKTVDFGGRYYFDYGCRLVQRGETEALAVLRSLRRAGN